MDNLADPKPEYPEGENPTPAEVSNYFQDYASWKDRRRSLEYLQGTIPTIRQLVNSLFVVDDALIEELQACYPHLASEKETKMDNQERVRFEGTIEHISTCPGELRFEYDRLFTLDQFKEKYDEDNCTIMLQDQERFLYLQKIHALAGVIKGDPDRDQNIQAAIDDWKPCDDRPPTEIEAKAQEVLSMSPQAQAVFIRHITAGIAQQAEEKARIDAEKAAEQSQAIENKFQPPADVGPPVTSPQQEPEPPVSFEQLGADADRAALKNADAVEVAEAVQAADIEASGEDLRAPTTFEEGGSEGVIEEVPGQTEVGMPPATER